MPSSPDIPAWASYLIVLTVGTVVAVSKVNDNLSIHHDRWSFPATWQLFAAYVFLPVALFWFLDYTSVIRDTSLFPALLVAAAYPAVFAGKVESVPLPPQVSALWQPLQAWASRLSDRIATMKDYYSDLFDERVESMMVGHSDRLDLLRDVSLAHAQAAEARNALDQPRAEPLQLQPPAEPVQLQPPAEPVQLQSPAEPVQLQSPAEPSLPQSAAQREQLQKGTEQPTQVQKLPSRRAPLVPQVSLAAGLPDVARFRALWHVLRASEANYGYLLMRHAKRNWWSNVRLWQPWQGLWWVRLWWYYLGLFKRRRARLRTASWILAFFFVMAYALAEAMFLIPVHPEDVNLTFSYYQWRLRKANTSDLDRFRSERYLKEVMRFGQHCTAPNCVVTKNKVSCDAVSGPVTVNLRRLSQDPFPRIEVCKNDSSANMCTLLPDNNGMIDDLGRFTLAVPHECASMERGIAYDENQKKVLPIGE